MISERQSGSWPSKKEAVHQKRGIVSQTSIFNYRKSTSEAAVAPPQAL